MGEVYGTVDDLCRTRGAGPSAMDATPAVDPRAARWTWRLLAPIAISLLIAMAFMPALSAGFVHWDDDDLLFTQTTYQQLTGESLRWMFTTSYAGHFQPLTWLTYAMDYRVWGHAVFGYHLTNVLLHLFTAVGVYFVSRRLLAHGPGSPASRASRDVVLAAAFAATLFAVHPLRAESVAWIAERRDVLSGLFYVLAVLAYVRYAESGGSQARVFGCRGERRLSLLNYLAAIAFCLLSLLAKASAVMLPFVLLILDVFPLRRLQMSRRGIQADRRVWLEKLPFFALGALAGFRAVLAQAQSGAMYSLPEHGLAARLAQAVYGSVFYLWKTVWPTDLGPLYPIPQAEVLFGTMLWTSLAALAILLAVAIVTHRRWPALATALAVYAVQVLPVLGLAQSGPQLVADRYSYLSCLGLAVVGGAIMLKWLRRGATGRSQAVSGLTAVASVGLVVALCHATFAQNAIWDTPLSLWMQGVRVSPDSSVAHVNLADALATNGHPRSAIRFYRVGLALEPGDSIAASHLGRALEGVGDVPEAIRMYMLAITLDPARGDDCLRLARLLIRVNRAPDAADVLRRRAMAAPSDLEAASLLADMLATHPDDRVRSGAEAVRWATHVSRGQKGASGVAQLYLCTALAEAGRFSEAIATAEAALKMPGVAVDTRLASELRRRAELFRRNRTYSQGETEQRAGARP